MGRPPHVHGAKSAVGELVGPAGLIYACIIRQRRDIATHLRAQQLVRLAVGELGARVLYNFSHRVNFIH